MTDTDDHFELVTAWNALHNLMINWPDQLDSGDIKYMDVTDMADRVRGLALHLESAVRLSEVQRYDSSLALLRTALEHLVIDWLVFQGKTLIQRLADVSEQTWREWLAARAAGDEWTATIRSWSRTKRGEVRIVREGLFTEPDEEGVRRQISIYYFLLNRYRPTLGPPSAQVEGWSMTREQLRRMASENDALWRVYLTWSSLMTNLLENALVDEIDAGRLSAHYRFLSGYAHPVVDHRRDTYGRNALMGWPRYDHYSSELTLLYAITLGATELRNFVPALDSRPGTTVRRPDVVEGVLDLVEAAASHFWFLGANPHPFDVWMARNDASFKLQSADWQHAVAPEPAPSDVPYPADPLRRLMDMHRSAQELMTGLTYKSPWPHQDPLSR